MQSHGLGIVIIQSSDWPQRGEVACPRSLSYWVVKLRFEFKGCAFSHCTSLLFIVAVMVMTVVLVIRARGLPLRQAISGVTHCQFEALCVMM